MTQVTPPSAAELAAYFALLEVSSLVQHTVEQQLRADGELSLVQFQILGRLANSGGQARMTDLADGIVYSRSGLTYQAGLLEKAGLLRRVPVPADERSTSVVLTAEGRARVAQVMPDHVELVRRVMFGALSGRDIESLARVLVKMRDHLRTAPPRSARSRTR